ncbi:hypothetical protein BCR34DRAFT_588007 [Clohesyomyces aquaticus]|uniref:DUF4470 domain-containing protein n=1 Tax=Clohesyomyces aquaticus TaxID=1231657 RepID=A0A1Y1ZM99_9PLEO|nr:hypothetical protein BCR34DRAFT_588007 [Clohesyomyces aquaticus]
MLRLTDSVPILKSACLSYAKWSNLFVIIREKDYVPIWDRENRVPDFAKSNPLVTFGQNQYLWGNMPAIDIINMKKKEGIENLGRNINLLFGASGDCRNVIKLITHLLDGYNGQCNVVLSDRDFVVVARNIIILYLALHFDPQDAAPTMIHIWYSASIPGIALDMDELPTLTHGKRLHLSHASLHVVLQTDQWFRLAVFVKVPRVVTNQFASALRTGITLNPSREDSCGLELAFCPLRNRVGCQKFCENGILLPYGCSANAFDTPNPLSIKPYVDGRYQMSRTRSGVGHIHNMSKLRGPRIRTSTKVFFIISERVAATFCGRPRKMNIAITMYIVGAKSLQDCLPKAEQKFDCIEIANIADEIYIGPEKAFSIFGPLLRPKAHIPHATLILLFQNAAIQTRESFRAECKRDEIERNRQLLPYFFKTGDQNGYSDGEVRLI